MIVLQATAALSKLIELELVRDVVFKSWIRFWHWQGLRSPSPLVKLVCHIDCIILHTYDWQWCDNWTDAS